MRKSLVLLIILVLVGCTRPSISPPSSTPSLEIEKPNLADLPCASASPIFADVAETITDCLPLQANTAMVESLLSLWTENNHVVSTNFIKEFETQTDEFILFYHREDTSHGIAVLKQGDNEWEIAYENLYERYEHSGRYYKFFLTEPLKITDLNGDTRSEILYKSNIKGSSVVSVILFRHIDGDEFQLTKVGGGERFSFTVESDKIISTETVGLNGGVTITKTLQLERGKLIETDFAQSIIPEKATLSLDLEDGTQYLAFNGRCALPCESHMGLYRLAPDGTFFHYESEPPKTIFNIRQSPNGDVYVGGYHGILQANENGLESIRDRYAPYSGDYRPLASDFKFTDEGEIWIAGYSHTFILGFEESKVIKHGTSALEIAEDRTVWGVRFDRENEGCCLYHFDAEGGLLGSYQFADWEGSGISAEIYDSLAETLTNHINSSRVNSRGTLPKRIP